MSDRDGETGGRVLRAGPAVFLAAAALAFLLPFGTVSCDGETVSFTGFELAAMHVPPDAAAAPDPDGGLAAEVEAWSPDGRLIAFASNRGAGGIFTVRSDGSCIRRLTAGDQCSKSSAADSSSRCHPTSQSTPRNRRARPSSSRQPRAMQSAACLCLAHQRPGVCSRSVRL